MDRRTTIEIPETSLVVMIGPSGAGKTTFARKHFLETEVISSDHCRAMISDDPSDQSVTQEAFRLLNAIAGARLDHNRIAVADATSTQHNARKNLLELAGRHNVPAVAIALNVPEDVCQQRNDARTDRKSPPQTVRRQCREMRKALRGLRKEGFSQVHVLGARDLDEAILTRKPMASNRKEDHGPFDLIGDIHGCIDELVKLLNLLGYEISERESEDSGSRFTTASPAGRKAVFLGDLVDRGPGSHRVLQLARDMQTQGNALCVMGNHDNKLMRKLMGRNVQISHGLEATLEQLEGVTEDDRGEMLEFLQNLPHHLVLDGGRLVACHAGIKEEFQGKDSRRVREFCYYGETTGETDEWGLPVRGDWARDYRGKAAVAYGHTPVDEADWLNNTICLDTGACFGGKLTALRWPEKETVSVKARRTYYEPLRPAGKREAEDDGRPREVLDLKDVTGRRTVQTKIQGPVLIEEERAAQALETMSRFTLDPRWLAYLPPTMSPCETSKKEGFLERPEEAFDYYRRAGIPSVICQEKHMGSRAVIILGRTPEALKERMGAAPETTGVAYTRTGRRFFTNPELERQVMERARDAMEEAGIWELLQSQWAIIDSEAMPWSLKAQGLLREQYAPVGAAARHGLEQALALMAQAQQRGVDVGEAGKEEARRLEAAVKYTEAYRRYCWEVAGPGDVKIAPFHLLASEGQVHTDKDHGWHMEMNRKLAEAAPDTFRHTKNLTIDLDSEGDIKEATGLWEALTGEGGEGMVVKPLDFIARGDRGYLQPAVKCRGPEYLRIIYGTEYDFPENLERLRRRGLGAKRSLAMREFALGIEGLERFVNREPLHRVHECAFGVLALESEPVDPRL